MLRRYEILMLTVPEVTQDEVKSLESDLDRMIKKAKGTILSFEKWGKYRLAYPIRKNDYGIYCLYRFEMDTPITVLDDIKAHFVMKLNDTVMRSMVTLLDMKTSLAYQRPQSLEEVPTRDVATFLKENKMEGLLSSVDKKEGTAKKEATPAPTEAPISEKKKEKAAPEEPKEASKSEEALAKTDQA